MNQARRARFNYRSLVWVSAAFLSVKASKLAGSSVTAASALDTSSSSSSFSSFGTTNSNKPPPPLISTGLVNLANTCYLNSQLQCAFHIPRVRHLILSPTTPFAPKKNHDGDDDSVATSSTISSQSSSSSIDSESVSSTAVDDPIEVVAGEEEQYQQQPQPPPQPESPGLQSLRLVFQDMVHAASSSVGTSSSIHTNTAAAVSPRAFTRAMGIPVLEQQDAQEFWKLLLPALNVPQLTDLYQGAFQDYIVALDGSGRERRREEPFLDLSLDIVNVAAAAPASPTTATDSSVVLSLKQMFGKPELLSNAEGNGWRPETGADKVGADKVDAHKGSLLRTQGLPSILQLHLKRFNYDWNTETMNKINDAYSFPKELDLSCVMQDNDDDKKGATDLVTYDLQAIVVHMGIYGQGHYYSYVRPDVRNDDWYRFDDEQVTPVTYQDVVADATGGKQSLHSALDPQQQKQGGGGGGPLGFLRGLFRGRNSAGFGYGGRTSNAYVIQYVRRCDIPMLYDIDHR